MSSMLPVRVASWLGPVLSSLVTSPVPVFGSLLAVSLGRAPEPDDPLLVTGVCGGKSCSVSSAIFFWGSHSG